MDEQQYIDIVEDIKNIQENIEHIEGEILEFKVPQLSKPTQSTEQNELFGALAKTQSEMETASKDSVNPHFRSKYSTLASMMSASRPYLSKNGLCVIQELSYSDGKSYLTTTLAHSSGQFRSSKMIIPSSEGKIQTLGSYITYLKRYMYAAATGVVSADDLDDDGNAAMPKNGNGYVSSPQTVGGKR